MITDEELMRKIDEVSSEYVGQIDTFYHAVGMLVVGRLFGWEVMRLVSSRKEWTTATRLFGDPKDLLPGRGKLARKSWGLKIADTVGSVTLYVKGKASMPLEERRLIE